VGQFSLSKTSNVTYINVSRKEPSAQSKLTTQTSKITHQDNSLTITFDLDCDDSPLPLD